MCCKQRAAARRNGVYQRQPTKFRMLVEHIIQKHQEKRALKQAAEYGSTSEKQEHGVVRMEEGRKSSGSGHWEWVDEKKQLQMMDGGSSMREPELPTYQAAVGRT